jgi:hypothetical protein
MSEQSSVQTVSRAAEVKCTQFPPTHRDFQQHCDPTKESVSCAAKHSQSWWDHADKVVERSFFDFQGRKYLIYDNRILDDN